MFEVSPVKKIKSSVYLKDDEVISPDGVNNYIAAISINNGIKGLSNYPATNKGNVITVSTTVDSANTLFYQEQSFVGRQQITGLRLKDQELNRSLAMYFISAIRKHLVNFSYGTKLTADTLKNTTLSLPVTPDGTPDYDFMERYVGAIEKLHVHNLVSSMTQESDLLQKLVS